MSNAEQQRGVKLRRITRACDYCNRRSIRCVTTDGSARCQNCAQFDQACTYAREMKRRGAKPKSRASPLSPSASQAPSMAGMPSMNAISCGPEQPWKAPTIAAQAVIVDLVDVYFEIVYPIFPLFHRPTYVRKVSRGDYLSDRNLFATTMAVCALASARVRDQALYNTSWDLQTLSQTASEKFYEAAIQACTRGAADRYQVQDLNCLRTPALLALTAIQYGRIREMQDHLGRYHTLVAMDGLHDEANWPPGLGIVETEERRRLFWSIYTLEIYTSIIWNGVTRVREQQVNVAYTTELDDEYFSDRGYSQRDPSPSVQIGTSPGGRWGDVSSSSWICGWNFTTDLYRIMEHVITNFRDRKRYRRTFLGEMFGGQSTNSSPDSVREGIMRLYGNLPQCFKECPEVTCDPASDRFGFQAANITATVQLIRMLLFASSGSSIEARCKIASEVVDDFSRIPVAYLRATSSPLLHHLAGIGAILGSVFEEPLTESAYQQVRAVLLSLAQLLESLDHGMHSTASAAKLRSLVSQIDEYMGERRETRDVNSPAQVFADLDFSASWPWDLDFMQLTGSWSTLQGDAPG